MLNELLDRYPQLINCRDAIVSAGEAMIQCYKNRGKLLLCGNGGSSADCDHIVGELMKSFLLKRQISDQRLPAHLCEKLQSPLPAISLCSQSAALSAFINDAEPSISGNASNVVNAATVARAIGIGTVALTGERNSKLSEICDITVRVPETETYKIQELHLPIYHYLCAYVEAYFFGSGDL